MFEEFASSHNRADEFRHVTHHHRVIGIHLDFFLLLYAFVRKMKEFQSRKFGGVCACLRFFCVPQICIQFQNPQFEFFIIFCFRFFVVVAGMSYCVGSVPRKGVRATDDGTVVGYIKAAGGIPLLVSNTPEYCTSWESSNKVNGRSLNPYDTRKSSGGSSGGEVSFSLLSQFRE